MPSHRGLTCNLQIKRYLSDGNSNDEIIEFVPAIHTLTDVESNTITTCVAVKPGWFDIVLEVNEFISEYLVMYVIPTLLPSIN